MIKKLTVLVFALVIFTMEVHAQYNTGDSNLNSSLLIIDDGAKADESAFKTEMSVSYNVPETKITSWLKSGLKPGDVFLSIEIGRLTKKPVDDVVKVYQSNKKKGWGAIAKDLGIKPGSPEFHALKGNADTKAKKSKSNQKEKAGKAKPKN